MESPRRKPPSRGGTKRRSVRSYSCVHDASEPPLRQVHQGAAPGERPGGEHLRPAPGQGAAALAGQGVDVEQLLPLRGGGAAVGAHGRPEDVGLPGGAAPHAAGAGGVGPEVVEHAVARGDGGDAVRVVEERLDVAGAGLEGGAGVGGPGGGIVRIDPGPGALVVEVLEPVGCERGGLPPVRPRGRCEGPGGAGPGRTGGRVVGHVLHPITSGAGAARSGTGSRRARLGGGGPASARIAKKMRTFGADRAHRHGPQLPEEPQGAPEDLNEEWTWH